MKIFKKSPKYLVATLILTITAAIITPSIPEKGMPPECSVCSENDDDEHPHPIPTIPRS